MLAPRKKLWSTPDPVIDAAIRWVQLKPNDVVCDPGCGDGRVLLRWATAYSTSSSSRSSDAVQQQQQRRPDKDDDNNNNDDSIVMSSFIGIDIDEERIRQANAELQLARERGKIHLKISVRFYCKNALVDCSYLYQESTVFFVYLIPRGLRLIKPLLLLLPTQQNKNDDGSITDNNNTSSSTSSSTSSTSIHVFTYMSPFEDETPIREEKITVEHQPGANWPLYLYKLDRSK